MRICVSRASAQRVPGAADPFVHCVEGFAPGAHLGQEIRCQWCRNMIEMSWCRGGDDTGVREGKQRTSHMPRLSNDVDRMDALIAQDGGAEMRIFPGVARLTLDPLHRD